MELQTVEIEGKTYAQVQDGKPVYKDGEKEIAFDAPGTVQTITRLNGEAKGHREAKESAEKALKAFGGISDPEAALKALETVQGLDDGKLLDAEKAAADRKAAVDAAVKEYVKRAEEAEADRDGAKKALHQEKIGGSFARSKFIAEKLAVPAPMVEKTFGDHFTIEDGKIVAKDGNGNPVYSKANPGDLAGFDEAMEILVEGSPFRDNIMKGRGQSGSGAPGGGGGGTGKTISRAEFDQINRTDPTRAAKMVTAEGITVTD